MGYSPFTYKIETVRISITTYAHCYPPPKDQTAVKAWNLPSVMIQYLRVILLAKEKIKREEKHNMDIQNTVRNMLSPHKPMFYSLLDKQAFK